MKRPPGWMLGFSIALGLLGASCSGPANYPKLPRGEGPSIQKVDMRGETTFFTGGLRVAASVTRGLPRREHGEDRGGGGRMGGGRRRGGPPGGGGMGHPPGDYGSERGGDGEGRPMRQPQMSAPPLTLQVKFVNLSAAPIDVWVRDVKSDLGDFAARPEHVVVAPGEEAALDPMVSELGVAAAEIPITVSLRSNGTTETQVMVVKAEKLAGESDKP